jgi:hypothetical protein
MEGMIYSVSLPMKKNGEDELAGPMSKAEVIDEGAGAGHLSCATEDTNES